MGKFKIRLEFEKLKKLNTDFNISVLVNVFALGLVLACCDLKYEVSDDFVMSTIISGAYGYGENPHLMFSNIMIGYILFPLYKLIPHISWYFIMHVVVIFVSSTIVTYILMERLERIKAAMLSSFLILFFVNDMYILVQFTKTAMFAVMVGSLFFLDALFYEKGNRRMVMGGILCIVGTWIRYSIIYMAGGFLILILTYEGLRIIRETTNKKKLSKRFYRIIISGCILIGFACGSNRVDAYMYSKNDGYAFFNEYGTARSRIVDYVDYGYEKYAEELEKIGVSENDYNMMKKWCFADNDYFTLERMKKAADIIVSYNKKHWNGWEDLIERIQNRKITNYPVFWANILLVFIGIFLNCRNIWITILANGIGWGYIVYFFIRDRLVYRTEFAVFLGIFLCVLYFWLNTENGNHQLITIKKSCCVIIVIIFAMRGIVYLPDRTYRNVVAENKKDYIESVFFESWNYDTRKYRKVVNKIGCQSRILDEIYKNKNNFYFLDFSTTIQTLYYEWSPWEPIVKNEYDNYLYLAGVTSNFPDVVEKLEDKKLENPLKSLVNKNVYLVDNNHIELKINYLRQHYYPNAWAELYKEVDGYQIWKVHEK